MPHEVTMPQLGMAQDTGTLVAWLKKPGEAVAQGDALFEVETDKATMEVEAQAAGFLVEVSAAEGEDVPVGRVIARISETADAAPEAPAAAPEAPAASPADALPDGRSVIMPALGMAQDTGRLVEWHVAPGDAVAEGDVLFEVETDKTTMEVAAEAAGFVAALLAEDGEDVPVGERVAILSAERPDAPVKRARAAAPVSASKPRSAPPSEPRSEAEAPKAVSAAVSSATPDPSGRILASPKARRLALEQGLDLARLAAAGHPQPFHVRDLEVLKALPAAVPAAAAGTAPAARRIVAEVPADGFAPFAAWAAEAEGLSDETAFLASFAAASLRAAGGPESVCVAVERAGENSHYRDPDRAPGRSESDPEALPADLVLRDLRLDRIASVELGPEAAPVLTITRRGDGLAVTLECSADHLTAEAALALASGFAGRLEEPLRHLL